MGNPNEPFIYEIGEAVDHRGSLEYYNDLTISNYKRFYIVKNPTRGTVRAWHGHKKESKLVKVLKGEIALYLIKVEIINKVSFEGAPNKKEHSNRPLPRSQIMSQESDRGRERGRG